MEMKEMMKQRINELYEMINNLDQCDPIKKVEINIELTKLMLKWAELWPDEYLGA